MDFHKYIASKGLVNTYQQNEVVGAFNTIRNKIVVTNGHSIGMTEVANRIAAYEIDRLNSKVLFIVPNESMIGLTEKSIKFLTGRTSLRDNLAFSTPEHYRGRKGYEFIVIDNASDIFSDTIKSAVDGMMVTENSRLLVIGNPLDETSVLKEYYDDPSTKSLSFSCLDHENVRAELEGRPVPVPYCGINKDWITLMLHNNGKRVETLTDDVVSFEGVNYEVNKEFRNRVLGEW